MRIWKSRTTGYCKHHWLVLDQVSLFQNLGCFFGWFLVLSLAGSSYQQLRIFRGGSNASSHVEKKRKIKQEPNPKVVFKVCTATLSPNFGRHSDCSLKPSTTFLFDLSSWWNYNVLQTCAGLQGHFLLINANKALLRGIPHLFINLRKLAFRHEVSCLIYRMWRDPSTFVNIMSHCTFKNHTCDSKYSLALCYR